MSASPSRQRVYLVPISGLFSAVLIISLILSGKIVGIGGLTFTAAVIVFLKRAEGEDHFDAATDFSPFRLRE